MTRARLLLAAAAGLVLAGCETAPITGREQFIIVPEDQMAQMGAQAYQEIRKEPGVVQDARLTPMIQRVGARIAQASGAPNLNWRFDLIDDDTPNAFALPGGYVGVHTGLFKVVENEDQLAAVLGHEIAHMLARHHAERVSQQLALQVGLGAAGSYVSPEAIQLLEQAATLGVVLPFSRDQESEADHIGLIYMARAGYDPRAAVEFWQNMEALGGTPPEFLSTHPSPGNRIARLQQLMPKALSIYEQSR